MDEPAERRYREIDLAGFDAEDAILAFIERTGRARTVPVPRPHLTGGKSEAAQLLALPEAGIGGLELDRASGDAFLQLQIERLELARFPIELGEDPDLGPEHGWDHGHRDIIHRAHLVAAERVHFAQM